MTNQYEISIYFEQWAEEDREAGETNDRGVEVEHERVDSDTLRTCAHHFGIDEASTTDPWSTPNVWFSSTSPRKDRTHIEQGLDRYFSLHVHTVDDIEPDAEDYQRIADLIGVRFGRPPERRTRSAIG